MLLINGFVLFVFFLLRVGILTLGPRAYYVNIFRTRPKMHCNVVSLFEIDSKLHTSTVTQGLDVRRKTIRY